MDVKVLVLPKGATSRTIIVILIVIVVVGVGVGYLAILSTKPEEPKPSQNLQPKIPPSPSAQDSRAEALRQAIIDHLDKLAAKDVRGLMEIYVPDKAYLEWGGQAGSLAGKYQGTSNIRINWAAAVGNTASIKYRLENYDAKIDGDRAEVRYKLFLNGTGKLIGDFEMNIDALQRFVYVDGKWLMDYDLWIFRSFKTSIVADATVFPLHWKKQGDFSVWSNRAKELFPGVWP